MLLADELPFGGVQQLEIAPQLEVRFELLLEQAVRWVRLLAPLHLLPIQSFETTPQGRADGVGYLPLPSDYLRFRSLRMRGWEHSVDRLYTEGDWQERAQRHYATRATPHNPICVLGCDDLGNAVIHYYTVPRNTAPHLVESGLYVPNITLPTGEEDVEVEIDTRLADAVAYRAVSLYYDTVERADLSATNLQQALQLLQQLL